MLKQEIDRLNNEIKELERKDIYKSKLITDLEKKIKLKTKKK